MKFKDEVSWYIWVDSNKDPYGSGIIRYAERWADLMEPRLAAGEQFPDFAKATSREADTKGITGFMYGMAVNILAKVWEHGEQLRRWHNLDIQIGTEGEEANASGGVLNPALLNFFGPKS